VSLLGLFKKNEKNSKPVEPLDKLTPEGELPWGWHTANKVFTDKLKSEYRMFLNTWLDSRKLSSVEEYTALKSFVIYMEDVKRLCQNKGECFVYWRDNLFDDDYLIRQTERLKKLETELRP
jgi:hypothetical protein